MFTSVLNTSKVINSRIKRKCRPWQLLKIKKGKENNNAENGKNKEKQS